VIGGSSMNILIPLFFISDLTCQISSPAVGMVFWIRVSFAATDELATISCAVGEREYIICDKNPTD
jgi:hypothetical protein